MGPLLPFRAIVLLLVTTEMLFAATESAKEVKNVLLLLIDDGGFEMTPYGNTKIQTPNIAKFARNSVQFNNAFTSVSICSPSRAVILTGMPQHQNGMYGLNDGISHFSSFDWIQSLPRILRESGQYWTGIIGKKDIGPEYVYPFDFEASNEQFVLKDIGRNITFMKVMAENFLGNAQSNEKPFFLYVCFFDVHRAKDNLIEKYGQFLENWGDGSPGMGVIQDWDPITYSPHEVEVPFFTQDTLTARKDIAALYKGMSRLDQGIGIMLQLLKDFGFDENTLVILTSDNGVAFPAAKANFYDPGVGEPMFISSPLHKGRFGEQTTAMASTMDIVPTIMDWYGMDIPSTLTGKSLLPILEKEPIVGFDKVFSSHNFIEVTSSYPMRMMRTKEYKLLHNLNFGAPFRNSEDVVISPTNQELLAKTEAGEDTKWFKTLRQYYYRCEWELYDIVNDPQELKNLVNDWQYQKVLKNMQEELFVWQKATEDPWLCNPSGVEMCDGSCQDQCNSLEITQSSTCGNQSHPNFQKVEL